MFAKIKAFVLPVVLGFLILLTFHICLAQYLFQAEEYTIAPPAKHHLQALKLPQQGLQLEAEENNPFFATIMTNDQNFPDLATSVNKLRLCGTITKNAQIYAIIGFDGKNKLYRVGDKLGSYQLAVINQRQVLLQGPYDQIHLSIEKRP